MSFAATQFKSKSSKKSPPPPNYYQSTPRKPLTIQESYEEAIPGFIFRLFIFSIILGIIDNINPHEIDETDHYNKDKKKGKWITNNWWLVPIIIFSILLGVDIISMAFGYYDVFYRNPLWYNDALIFSYQKWDEKLVKKIKLCGGNKITWNRGGGHSKI